MQPKLLLSLAYFTAVCVAGPIDTFTRLFSKRAGSDGTFVDADFIDPRKGGGSLLNRSGSGGEPLNVIISGRSSPFVLTSKGFAIYMEAVGFSKGCLGLQAGDPQPADLGDGVGFREEAGVWREHFDIPVLGSCLQSLVGNNHFRKYGPQQGSGAIFLAVSDELDLKEHHTISPDGYNVGRDDLVRKATAEPQKFLRDEFTTTVIMLEGLLPLGAQGVNHGIALDGKIAMLTVTHRKLSIIDMLSEKEQE